MSNMSSEKICAEVKKLQQAELRNYIESSWGEDDWIILSDSNPDGSGKPNYYSAFGSNSTIELLFQNYSWDIQKGQVFPSSFSHYQDGQENIEYYRYGNELGLIPIIFHRAWPTIQPPNLEINEEFRFFHNLYHSYKSGKFIKFDDEGNKEIIVKIKGCKAEARKLHLYQFMASRGLNLILFIECIKTSKHELKKLGLDETDSETKRNNLF